MRTTKRAQSEREELLTVRQVLAELGGVSRDTFYEWRERRVAPLSTAKSWSPLVAK